MLTLVPIVCAVKESAAHGLSLQMVDIVDQLAARRDELAAPDCVERLAPSVFRALASGRAALHQVALVRAATTLCRSLASAAPVPRSSMWRKAHQNVC